MTFTFAYVFVPLKIEIIDLRKEKEIPHSSDDSLRFSHDSTISSQRCTCSLHWMLCFVENFLHLNYKCSRSKDRRRFDGTPSVSSP
ncbi:hypothetical protein T11_15611 [Trichinella zimbabwensis]|uniref:Uncharacterized protein n=1 Tax=Trichinella zimbabwensis TaxID=268475 RepID=A0A0V1H4F7_9BILA|nr:hypothetical protein T11_15611 [Trichinella zimbabwensis]